jgi:hypothetical protein
MDSIADGVNDMMNITIENFDALKAEVSQLETIADANDAIGRFASAAREARRLGQRDVLGLAQELRARAERRPRGDPEGDAGSRVTWLVVLLDRRAVAYLPSRISVSMQAVVR